MEDYKERIISLMESDECTDEEKAKLRKAFPELVESEDEKIRKRIIAFLRSPFVRNDIADDILAPWISWLEKVKDFEGQLEEAYRCADEVQFKRGYDAGYLDGIASAKRELEKQGKQEWTDDDERLYKDVIGSLGHGKVRQVFWYQVEWLKSVKERLQ